MMTDKEAREFLKKLVDEMFSGDEDGKTNNEHVASEKNVDNVRERPNAKEIRVSYTHADDGSDAKIVFPVEKDMGDIHVLSETVYAMAYAIGNAFNEHLFGVSSNEVANAIIGCVMEYLIKDTFRSMFDFGGDK